MEYLEKILNRLEYLEDRLRNRGNKLVADKVNKIWYDLALLLVDYEDFSRLKAINKVLRRQNAELREQLGVKENKVVSFK